MDNNEIITLSSDEEDYYGNLIKSLLKETPPTTTSLPCISNSFSVDKSQFKNNIIISSGTGGRSTKKNNKRTAQVKKVMYREIVVINNEVPRNIEINSGHSKSPELVDLVYCEDKSPEQTNQPHNKSDDLVDNMKDLECQVVKFDKIPTENGEETKNNLEKEEEKGLEKNKDSADMKMDVDNDEDGVDAIEVISNAFEKEVDILKDNETDMYNLKDKKSDSGSEFFREFVNLCGSLEVIKNDRIRLIGKLNKRFQESDPSYVQSEAFRILIEKSREKLTKNSLYFIAKEVSDELSSRKKIKIATGKLISNKDGKGGGDDGMCEESEGKDSEKINKKRTKTINKIVRRLDRLGMKIRELEEKEVEFNEEEESSYISLQRHRERFCQIYKKLCEYTNEISDANRAYSRTIRFSGSKYPAINKCIETWLNKTKRFPDFNDIMKLLESQSTALDLPSHKESIRVIAIEIFQKVGEMLQRRRQYDLWDSYCGFLGDTTDPAKDDPNLNKILKENFEKSVQKEKEILNYYAKRQEIEKLEPEEVPEDEANNSPIESGNEDEKEIEEIEKSINERLDIDIEEVQFLENGKDSGDGNFWKDDWDECGNSSGEENGVKNKCNDFEVDSKEEDKVLTPLKESKNNYKNCKSLKWRGENKGKQKEDIVNEQIDVEDVNSKHLATDIVSGSTESKENEKVVEEDGEKKRCEEVSVIKSANKSETESAGVESNEDMELEITEVKLTNTMKTYGRIQVNKPTAPQTVKPQGNAYNIQKWPKRDLKLDKECTTIKRRKYLIPVNKPKGNSQAIEIENEKGKEIEEVVDVRYCHVEMNYGRIFENPKEDFSEKRKDWGMGKIFRDLTNLDRLMETKGKKRKLWGLFSPSYYHPDFHEFDKPSWKKRYKVNYRYVCVKDQKCALNHEEKTEKSLNGDGRHPERKDVQNNSESGRDEGSNFCSGNGSEGDNNENDENRRNGKAKDDFDEKMEEEEEKDESEDELNAENESQKKVESGLHSFNNSTNSENVSIDNFHENENPSEDSVGIKSDLSSSQKSLERMNSSEDVMNEEEEEEEEEDEDEEEEEEDENDDKSDYKSYNLSGKALRDDTVGESQKYSNENDSEKVEFMEEEQDITRGSEEENPESENDYIQINKSEENFEPGEGEREKGVSDEMTEDGEREMTEEEVDETEEGHMEFNGRREAHEEVNGKETEDEEVNGNGEEETEENGEIIESQSNNRQEEGVKYDTNVKSESLEESFVAKEEKNETSRRNTEELMNLHNNVVHMQPQREYLTVKKEKDMKPEGMYERVKMMEPNNYFPIQPDQMIPMSDYYRNPVKEEFMNYGNYPFMRPTDRTPMDLTTKNKKLIKSEYPDPDEAESFNRLKKIKTEFETDMRRSVGAIRKDFDINKANPGGVRSYKRVNPKATAVMAKRQLEKVSFVESVVQKIRKRNNPNNAISTSDEERVKKFLLHSPSSISITPPKKLTMAKPPSQAALQALATLRGLKGISATRVKSRPRTEDDVVVIGESSKKVNNSNTSPAPKRRKSNLPVISNVQSIKSTTPKIVTVQGNVSDFGNVNNTWYNWMNNGQPNQNSSSIRISNVWGSLPNTFVQPPQENIQPINPSCSFQQNQPPFKGKTGNGLKKKSPKKTVEYVVLE